jgi:ABC-2 type transport system permease protein
MSPARTFTTAGRVLRQLSHDKRTLGLLFVVPPLLITLLKYVFNDRPLMFEGLAPLLLGIFPMILMFLITSIATLRERTNGTLDRLMSMPIAKIDFIAGYALAFFAVALVQAVIVCVVVLGALSVPVMGGVLPTVLGAISAALLGTSLGLFASAFARSEFQAVQFMPAFIFPQLLLCGLFIARDQMARPLQLAADVFPLSYSVEAMQQVTLYNGWTLPYDKDLFVIAGWVLLALILASFTIRRQSSGAWHY